MSNCSFRLTRVWYVNVRVVLFTSWLMYRQLLHFGTIRQFPAAQHRRTMRRMQRCMCNQMCNYPARVYHQFLHDSGNIIGERYKNNDKTRQIIEKWPGDDCFCLLPTHLLLMWQRRQGDCRVGPIVRLDFQMTVNLISHTESNKQNR